MIGSEWAARSQRLSALAIDATCASFPLEGASKVRAAAEEALARNEAELARLPKALKEAEVEATASEAALQEAQRKAERTSDHAECADLICTQLRLVISALSCDDCAEAGRRAAFNLRLQLPDNDFEGLRAIKAVEAVANSDPESSGELITEAARATERAQEAAREAADATGNLREAERYARDAQREAERLSGRLPILEREAPELATALEEARRAEAVARGAYDAVASELAALKQEHADAEAADAPAAERDDAAHTVIRIEVRCVSPNDEECDFEDETLLDEAGDAFSAAHKYLVGLGAACCSEFELGSSPAATYFLTFDRALDAPTDAEGRLHFGKIEKDLIGSGLRLEVECIGSLVAASAAYRETACSRHDLCDGHSRTQWLEHLKVEAEQVEEALADLKAVDGDIECASMFFDSSKVDAMEFAVEGMVPYGCSTVIAALGGTGKSHFAAELLAAFCADENSLNAPLEVLGALVNQRGGVAAYIYSEDPEEEIAVRLNELRKIWPGRRPITHRAQGRQGLLDVLAKLERLPPHSLVVLDPGGKYLDGPDTDTNAVNRLFAPLEDFAARKKAAVLVTAHMNKGALARPSLVRWSFKGSTAWVDNPRVAIAMIGQGERPVDIVMAKSNISGLMWREGEGARFRKEGGRFLPVQGSAIAVDMVDLAMIERVYDAFINAHGPGSAIQKTGARSLFALKLPELASLSRNQVGDAIDALIAEGRIAKGPHGLEPTIPPAPTE